MPKNNSKETHYGKGDNDTRTDAARYYENRAKVKKVREFDTSGFKVTVNGKEVK